MLQLLPAAATCTRARSPRAPHLLRASMPAPRVAGQQDTTPRCSATMNTHVPRITTYCTQLRHICTAHCPHTSLPHTADPPAPPTPKTVPNTAPTQLLRHACGPGAVASQTLPPCTRAPVTRLTWRPPAHTAGLNPSDIMKGTALVRAAPSAPSFRQPPCPTRVR
jgi:hypothetical protein